MLLNEEQTNLRRTINEYNQQLDQMRELRKQLDEELHQTQMKRSQALINKNYWHEKIESEKQALEGCRDGFSAQERVVQEFTRKASLICPRIVLEPGATEAKFGKIMQKLTKELEDSEKRIGGSTEEITRACETATKNWLNAKDNVFQIENLLKVMDSTYKERTFRWRKFRKYISVKARGQFMWLMSQRGYRGRLYLDHQSRELKLEVQPSQQESDTGRGPRTLSGGERSFSTVCLLLALWEAMGSPIRCLDEFDVFMDSVNRTISVKMMIEAAQRSAGRQFILITPQDMSSINRSTDVKITRLRDPERNQSSLDRQIARG
ncbi:P-loop containing nucleoside triphosphate hydrolase protein [Kalaharituber pfeilii]|nr:P-loop containing nucleoside triphosphate hydrolase protein [Kalaharituber pfeilii]